ncbi:hypothetical protein C6497_16750 [Candidatus Poribacteria bacterium]|nr:MAG: hypothetical protein C6497_16750 [Candidatus Poribacteria bacterium]
MPDRDIAESNGNYKGLLIQYCQERGMNHPRFTETQHGTADAPSWKVTVEYGDRVHETMYPIPGAKKEAHQFAAKEILESINENRERLLTGEENTDDNSIPESLEEQPIESTNVPLSLFTSALTVANERLGSSQPSRYRSITDVEYSQKLAQLTIQIVTDLVKAADKSNIEFPDA